MNIRLLRGLSTAYLLIPNLLFFCFWTKPAIAIVGIGILAYLFVNQSGDAGISPPTLLRGKDLSYLGAIALSLTLVSGTAGICHQVFDHWGHNVKLYELYKNDWPMTIHDNGPAVSYYYGHYLVPALFSKLIGSLSTGFMFFWTFVGLLLGIAWLYVVLEKKMAYVLLCLCIGDVPAILKSALTGIGLPVPSHDSVGLTIWSLTANLVYAPNQVIPTLLIGGMLVYGLKNRADIEEMTFPIALSLWWAVFPALISGLLVGILILRKWLAQKFQLNWPAVVRQVLLPVFACLPVLLLYGSHNEVPDSGFVWQFGNSPADTLAEYLTTIGFNFLLFLLTFWAFRKYRPDLPDFPFYLLLGLLLVFPLYRLGMYNDMLLRGMMPITLVLGLYLLMPLASEPTYRAAARLGKRSVLSFAMLFMLLFSAGKAVKIVGRALKENVVTARIFPDRVAFKPLPPDRYPNSYEMLLDKYGFQGASEYLGKRDSFYENYVR